MRARSIDGYELHCEETGKGIPVVFVHEFAGDHRSWEPQLRHFGRTYRCITFSARGFAPSDIPQDEDAYTQVHAADDILSVLDALGVETAHVVGLSMGSLAALHFAIRHPQRTRSICLGGCGYGSDLDQKEAFKARSEQTSQAIMNMGMKDFARLYATGVGRVQFANKDPRGYAEFLEKLSGHDATGSALTQKCLQGRRPSIYELKEELRSLTVPTLVVHGDEDFPCFQPGVYLKRMIRSAALTVLPNTGHSLNLEETGRYNRLLEEFLHQVDSGRWPCRDDAAEPLPDFRPFAAPSSRD